MNATRGRGAGGSGASGSGGGGSSGSGARVSVAPSTCGSPSSGAGPATAAPPVAVDSFTQWVDREKARHESSIAGRLVNRQLLTWVGVVYRLRARSACAQSRRDRRRRRNRRSGRDGGCPELAVADRGMCKVETRNVQAGLPRLVRDLVFSFVGDQCLGAVTALSLRRRAETIRLRDLWRGLLPELDRSAEQGSMSFHINQNIEQLAFWRPWMQEPEAVHWIRSCLEARGLKVESCRLYHTAYAGMQGCTFFELKISWVGP